MCAEANNIINKCVLQPMTPPHYIVDAVFSNCLVASTSETIPTTSKSGLQAFQVIHIQEVDDRPLYSITGLVIRWYLPYFTYGGIKCSLGVYFLNHYNIILSSTWSLHHLKGKAVHNFIVFLQSAHKIFMDPSVAIVMYLIDILGVNMAFHTKDVSCYLESKINSPPS